MSDIKENHHAAQTPGVNTANCHNSALVDLSIPEHTKRLFTISLSFLPVTKSMRNKTGKFLQTQP